MKKLSRIFGLALVSVLLMTQVGTVFGASATEAASPLTGTVLKITLESEPTTGVTIVLVKLKGVDGGTRTVRISEETAKQLGLVTLSGDGNAVINGDALGQDVEIDTELILPDGQQLHPVASTLVTFFSDIDELDYEAVMAAHEEGNGFGVIAQALWMIRKLGGNSEDLMLLLEARKTGDFRDFQLQDGSIPASWSELRMAVAENPGAAMSHNNNKNNGSHGNPNNNGNPDNSNNNANNGHGNGHQNGNGNGNGNGQGNGNSNGNGNNNRP